MPIIVPDFEGDDVIVVIQFQEPIGDHFRIDFRAWANRDQSFSGPFPVIFLFRVQGIAVLGTQGLGLDFRHEVHRQRLFLPRPRVDEERLGAAKVRRFRKVEGTDVILAVEFLRREGPRVLDGSRLQPGRCRVLFDIEILGQHEGPRLAVRPGFIDHLAHEGPFLDGPHARIGFIPGLLILENFFLHILLIQEDEPTRHLSFSRQHLFSQGHTFIEVTAVGKAFRRDFDVERLVLCGQGLTDRHDQRVVLHFMDFVDDADGDVLPFLGALPCRQLLDGPLVLPAEFPAGVLLLLIAPEDSLLVLMRTPN